MNTNQKYRKKWKNVLYDITQPSPTSVKWNTYRKYMYLWGLRAFECPETFHWPKCEMCRLHHHCLQNGRTRRGQHDQEGWCWHSRMKIQEFLRWPNKIQIISWRLKSECQIRQWTEMVAQVRSEVGRQIMRSGSQKWCRLMCASSRVKLSWRKVKPKET